MGEITLQPGENKKLVSQPGADASYNIAVTGADVFLSHREGLVVQEGKRVRPGDRVTLENLRGKPVYAKNPSTNADAATLEINQAGFNLIFQPRAVQASVQTNNQDESAPATDDFTEATGSSVSIGSGGSVTETLAPPGRSDQISIHVEGTASFDVVVTWNNTSETFSSGSGVVKEVLPVYFISDDIDVQITDTSGGANSVNYDMVVV